MIISGRQSGIAIGPFLLAAALSGCALTEPRVVEKDFRTSVRQVMSAQTNFPLAAVNPQREPVEGMDGDKGIRILDAYREDIAKPEEIQNVINIAVGSQ